MSIYWLTVPTNIQTMTQTNIFTPNVRGRSRLNRNLPDGRNLFSFLLISSANQWKRLNISNVNTVSGCSSCSHGVHTNTNTAARCWTCRKYACCYFWISELHSAAQYSTFKWTPCGLCLSNFYCQTLPEVTAVSFSFGISNSRDLVALCHSVMVGYTGCFTYILSCYFAFLFFFFFWPATTMQ